MRMGRVLILLPKDLNHNQHQGGKENYDNGDNDDDDDDDDDDNDHDDDDDDDDDDYNVLSSSQRTSNRVSTRGSG